MDLFADVTAKTYNLRNRLIRFFGLPGSWKWAKKQMMQGRVVRCKHWTGTLKYRVQSQENPRLICTFSRNLNGAVWENANHFLCYELFTDYEICE